MAFHRKLPNDLYSLKLPIHIHYDWEKNRCLLLDKHDTIIADNLTKEIAETLMQAVNYCAISIDFVKFFVEWEDIVMYSPEISSDEIILRNAMYDNALNFMVSLGIVETPPTYINAFSAWRNELLNNNFYGVINK